MLRGEDVKMKNKVQLAPCIFGFRIHGSYQLWSWLYLQARNSWMQRVQCTHCTVSFYTKDLSICGFWYPWELLESTPRGYQGDAVHLGPSNPEAAYNNGKSMNSMVIWGLNPNSFVYLHYQFC